MMTDAPAPIAYVVKRFPRLTETFILNEILAMERLGFRLHVFSLMPPEPPPHHPMVQQVQAPVSHLPAAMPNKVLALLRSHAAALAASPRGYGRAVRHALRISLGSSAPLSVWRQFLRAGYFATLARQAGIGHVHGHFANAPSAVAHFLNLMTGLPFSFTAHAKDLYLTPAKLVAERAGAAEFVATCTGYNAQFLRDMLPVGTRHKVNLVYHGIDLTQFRYRDPPYAFAAAGTPPLVLCVGRLVPKKGLDDLLAACERLHAGGISFRCDIVGGGPLRDELQSDITARGLGEIVRLRGAMTHAALIDLYASADLFALAPRITEDGDRDGIPNVIVEAMAVGVPVVSTTVSGIPEMVRDGQTGLLVPPRDPTALAAAMARLLSDPALGRRLAAAGLAELDRCFDCWETTRALGAMMGNAAPASASRMLRCDPVAPERALEPVG